MILIPVYLELELITKLDRDFYEFITTKRKF